MQMFFHILYDNIREADNRGSTFAKGAAVVQPRCVSHTCRGVGGTALPVLLFLSYFCMLACVLARCVVLLSIQSRCVIWAGIIIVQVAVPSAHLMLPAWVVLRCKLALALLMLGQK
jgi:hypothetical protein